MITSQLRPLAAPTATETSWLVPNLLAAGEIVLLEGAAGVGKSLLAAAWMARVSKEGQGSVAGLVVTASTRAAELAASHLARHEANFDRLKNIHWSATSLDENGRREAVVNDMLTHFETHLAEHKPKLLVIDALEEVLVELASEPAHWQRHFWDRLQKTARHHGCTILILSRPCVRRDRAGRVGRLAADYARCCYTLAWHPTDTAQRVLTRTRDPLAATGAQWHVGIDGDGRAECFTAPDNDHVPPGQGSAPVTWQSRRQKSDNVPRILKELEAYVAIKTPAFLVREHILSQGYSYSAFRHSDIEHKREAGAWWYVPGPEHVARNALRTAQTPKPSCKVSRDAQAERATPIRSVSEGVLPRVAPNGKPLHPLVQSMNDKVDRFLASLPPHERADFQAGRYQKIRAKVDALWDSFTPEEHAKLQEDMNTSLPEESEASLRN